MPQMDNKAAKSLVCAILAQAFTDLEYFKKQIAKWDKRQDHPRAKQKINEAAYEIQKLREFFKSDWYDDLAFAAGYGGDYLLKQYGKKHEK